MSFTVNCPHCDQSLEAENEMKGMEVECPECGNPFTITPPAPKKQPRKSAAPQREVKTDVKQGAIIGGFVCLVLGVALMFISLLSFIVYLPLFLAAFILSIVAMAQKRVVGGVLLLLLTIIVPSILGVGLFVTRTAAFAEEVSQAMEEAEREAREEIEQQVEGAVPIEEPEEVAPPEESKPNPIVGAFGVQLGASFDTDSAIDKGALTDGTVMYQFTPDKVFRGFDRYYVMVTPTTKKIYSIWAIASFDARAKGSKEQSVVFELLKDKYGNEQKRDASAMINHVRVILIGSRRIVVKLDGYSKSTVDIRYYDGLLEKAAEQERLAIEKQKMDSSGL